MRISDWSSDVCSSDLPGGFRFRIVAHWRGCRTQSPSNRNLTCGNDDFPELRVRFHIAIGFGYIRQRTGPVDHGAKDPSIDPRTDELLAPLQVLASRIARACLHHYVPAERHAHMERRRTKAKSNMEARRSFLTAGRGENS